MQQREKLRNIGPQTARRLAEIGIETRDQLAKNGIEETTRRLLFRFGGEARLSINLIYALEGAIHDHDWRDITTARKQALSEYFKRIKAEIKARDHDHPTLKS
jgi:DNA transformation protein